MQKNIKYGNKLIVTGYSVFVVWFLCYMYFINIHSEGPEDLGLGVLVIGSFALALLCSFSLILIGLVFSVYFLIVDKDSRNVKNKIISCSAIITFFLLLLYILFFLKF